MKKIISLLLALSLCLSFVACGETTPEVKEPVDGWVCAWGSAMQQVTDSEKLPQNTSLNENTFRQVIVPTLGGEKLRLTFSNVFGSIPLQIQEVKIAKLVKIGSSEIIPETELSVTFEGATKINIEAGLEAITDEIAMNFNAYEPLAVSVKFGKYIGGAFTGHTFNYQTAWIAEGNQVSAVKFEKPEVSNCAFYLSRMDVWAKAGTTAVVALGDSITEGIGATVDAFSRWPDVLNSLNNQNGITNVSVVNMGIGGQRIEGYNPVSDRIERDLLNIAGVDTCILLLGANDIGMAKEDTSQKIIDAIEEVVKTCKDAGIKIYVGTIMPMKNHDYYTAEHEAIRQAVNAHIRKGEGYDGVIDFDALFQDPADPEKMKEEYNSPWKDYLHPGDAGYKAMADLAYEILNK